MPVGNTPQLPDTKRILRAQVIVGVLAVVGVVAFLLLYLLMEDTAPVQRLLIALCVPPALMAILVGGYFIVRGSSNTGSRPEISDD